MGGPDMAPHTPPPAPRSRWGLDRVSEPEGAPRPAPAPRSSWGLDRVSEPDTAGGSSRPGGAVALLGISRAPAGLLEDGLELELAPGRRVRLHHFEAGHRVVIDVTVLVEAPLAVDALEVLRGRDRLAQGLVLLDDAAQIDDVGARRADLRQHRLLVGLLPVDALVGDDRQSDLLGGRLEDVSDPFAVELLVVEDVDLLDAETLGPLRAHRALDVVGRDRAEVVREPARTVDLRLAGGGTALLGQSGVGVGRRDLGHVGAVGDGDRNLGGARVVGADVDDRQRVADGLVRVLGLDRAVPLARLRP